MRGLMKGAKLAWRAAKSNVDRLENPYKLTFVITYGCNSRCLTCDIWKMRPTGELTLKEIQRFAEQNPFFSWLNLTGGEPFQRKDIVQIAQAFAENCPDLYNCNLITNSFKPDLIAGRVEEILQLGIPRVIIGVSLDGYDELHRHIRGTEDAYDNAKETFLRFRELEERYPSFHTYFGYTISAYNLGQFRETVERVREHIPSITAKDFHVNLYHVSGHYYANGAATTSLQKAEVLEELQEITDLRGWGLDPVSLLERRYLDLAKVYVEKGRTPLQCKALDTSCFVDSYGNVFPCTIFGQKVGNLRDHDYSLTSILDGEKAQKTKEEVRALKCPNCWTPCEAYQMILANAGGVIGRTA